MPASGTISWRPSWTSRSPSRSATRWTRPLRWDRWWTPASSSASAATWPGKGGRSELPHRRLLSRRDRAGTTGRLGPGRPRGLFRPGADLLHRSRRSRGDRTGERLDSGRRRRFMVGPLVTWGLLAAWVIHDLEEWVAMPGWSQRAAARMSQRHPRVPARVWSLVRMSRLHAHRPGRHGHRVGVMGRRADGRPVELLPDRTDRVRPARHLPRPAVA